jgi:hypothetical protein
LFPSHDRAKFYRAFCKVVETKEGYFFEENNGGYFQIGQKEYEGSLKWTLGNMPNLDVQYSQPRERRD